MQHFDSCTGPMCILTQVATPRASTRSPGEQSQQMPGNVLELDAMRQLLFNVRFHLANNVVSIRRSGGIAEGLLQFRQESGHLVSLPSDHFSIDLPKMPTTVVDRRDAAIQYDGQV